MAHNSLLFLVLTLSFVFLISSVVAARDLSKTTSDKTDVVKVESNGVDDAKYGSWYGGGDHGYGWGGHDGYGKGRGGYGKGDDGYGKGDDGYGKGRGGYGKGDDGYGKGDDGYGKGRGGYGDDDGHDGYGDDDGHDGYGYGRGGYGDDDGYGRGRQKKKEYCHYGCCKRGYYGGCKKCCSYHGEALDIAKALAAAKHN